MTVVHINTVRWASSRPAVLLLSVCASSGHHITALYTACAREIVCFTNLSWFRHMLLPHRPSWSHFSLSLEIIFSSSLKFSLMNKYSSVSTKRKKTRPWEVYTAAFAHASVITLYSQSSGVIGSCLRSSLARLTDYPAGPACPYFACGPVCISSSSAHTPASPLTGGSTFTRTLPHWFPCLPPTTTSRQIICLCVSEFGVCAHECGCLQRPEVWILWGGSYRQLWTTLQNLSWVLCKNSRSS